MSAPAGTYHDGDFLWDSVEVTLNSKTFIFESWDPMEKATTDVSNNVNAVPRGARHRRTLMEFPAVCQFPSGSTLADKPAQFTTFTAPYGGVTKNWVIKEVGTPMKVGQEIKCNCTIAELINAPAS